MRPFRVVYDGVRQAELDVISIPALPTLEPKYGLKNQEQFLSEVLSHRFPNARIIAYQYDFAKRGALEASWLQLLEKVEGFLYGLVHRREGVESRPIFFVCSSFGAIILKKALLIAKEKIEFRAILQSTAGIVFLGCLNDETLPDFEDLCIKCAAVELGTPLKHDVIKALRQAEDWAMVREVMERFRLLKHSFQVRVLYERKVTSLTDRRITLRPGKPEQLCSERTASLGWEQEVLIGVNKDHRQIITYPDRGDLEGFFDIFLGTLSELVDALSREWDSAKQKRHGPTDSGDWTILEREDASKSVTLDQQIPAFSALSIAAETGALPNIPCLVIKPHTANPQFVGRNEILEEMRVALMPSDDSSPIQRTYALTGLGGMGKTQIAVEFAFRYRDIFPVTLWAHADSQARLAESFCLFATQLGLGENSNAVKARQAVQQCLAELDVPWLVILDNADGDDVEQRLQEFWPEAEKGAVLVTGRNRSLVKRLSGRELNELDEDSAVALLKQLTRFDSSKLSESSLEAEVSAAKQIVKRIGYLPLAINQAANIIVEDCCSFTVFLEAYSARDLILDSEGARTFRATSMYQCSLRTVWDMNFDRLNEDQRSLIQLMSFLDPDLITMNLLQNGAARANDERLSFIDRPYKLNKCRAGLVQSTLVSQSEDCHELQMHRLVQESCQIRMSDAERQHYFDAAVLLVQTMWPVPERHRIHNPSLWEEQRALLPYVQKLCQAYVSSCVAGKPLLPHDTVQFSFASLLYEAGWFCYESGLLNSVLPLLLPAQEYCLRHENKGQCYRLLADIYGGLGSLCTNSNQFQGAYDNFSKQLQYVKLAITHGELQRPTIWEVFALGRLGNGLSGLHRYEEAEEYYRKSLDIWQGLPGDRRIFISNLATCLWLQGKLNEGEQLLRGIIKDRNDVSSLRTGYAMYPLGNILISKARLLMANGKQKEAEQQFGEAMETHIQVLKLWVVVLGTKDSRTADANYKVGWHFHRTRDYPQALKYLQEALRIHSMSPHLHKNEIARTKYKIGCLYQDNGNLEAGTNLIREAESLRQEIVPPEDWEPAKGEEDFDEILQFWSR